MRVALGGTVLNCEAMKLNFRRVVVGSLAWGTGAALFVLQPMLLHRMGGHFALGGQFVLLAGLLLCR